MQIDLVPEPALLFGSGRAWMDPKTGLLAHGPNRAASDASVGSWIRAGAIGTHSSVGTLKEFLKRLRRRIGVPHEMRTNPWKVDFPGLGVEGRLGFDFELTEDRIQHIPQSEETEIIALSDRKQRVARSLILYSEKTDLLFGGAHPAPQIVFLPISSDLLGACKDPTAVGDRIIYTRRSLGQAAEQEGVPLFDFHNAIKVLGFKHNASTQLLLPRTLQLSAGPQDPATLAWNFAVANYYKATGTPWKLADLDSGTCYVGISFYSEVYGAETNMRTSMAHVYMRTGESQIIRGKPFRWEGESNKSPILTSEQASEILTEVVDVYASQWDGRRPSRLVVHKSSPYEDAEIAGFMKAATGVDVLDLVHIYGGSSLRLYPVGTGYPPRRGTLFSRDGGTTGYLYTTGFIPAISTYPGSTVPFPLRFRLAKCKSDIRQIAGDLMALTKLDWNNTDFCIRKPVTLAVSEKVGNILAEPSARETTPPMGYKFYM